MADLNIGSVVAKITADSTEFQRGLAQAEQALQRFQQQTAQHAASLNQAMTPALRQAATGF